MVLGKRVAIFDWERQKMPCSNIVHAKVGKGGITELQRFNSFTCWLT